MYEEYVDSNLCCFIFGKVINEIFLILHTIKEDENLPTSSEILQELQDISTMEHFKDKIVPTLGTKINPFMMVIDSFKKKVEGYKKEVVGYKKKLVKMDSYKKKLVKMDSYKKKLVKMDGYKKIELY